MLFEVEKVTERIYRIIMPYVCVYLIIGNDRAILIDAGFGYGDLKAVVESITDLPVTLLLSHAHTDHIGGANQFDEVYLSERDFELIESQTATVLRRRLMLRFTPASFKDNQELWQAPRLEPYIPYEKDMTFDLGDLTILPYEMPGHTVGCMVFIIPEERIAIFGDALSHPTLMFFDHSSTVQEHYDAMVEFSQYSHLYDRVLVNHMTFELPEVVLDNNIEAAKAILDGTDEKLPASRRIQNLSSNGTVYTAKKRNPWLPMDLNKIGNIYYSKDKVK